MALCGNGFGEVQLKSLEAESKEMGEQKEAREHVFVKGLASKRPEICGSTAFRSSELLAKRSPGSSGAAGLFA